MQAGAVEEKFVDTEAGEKVEVTPETDPLFFPTVAEMRNKVISNA